MKFTIFLPRYHSNFHPYVGALIDRGHDVSLFVMRGFDMENYSLIKPTKLPPSKSLKNKSNMGSYEFSPDLKVLIEILRDELPDIVIFRGGKKFYLKLFYAMKRTNVKPLIYYNQSPILSSSFKASLLKRLVRNINSRFISPVRISPVKYQTPMGKDFEIDYQVFKASVFLPFIQKPIKHKRTYYKEDRLNILSVAKFMPFKNHQVLINALGLLKKRSSKPFQLTIIGTCGGEDQTRYYNEMMDLAKKNEIFDHLIIKLNLNHEEVLDEYIKHDLFVLPSSKEIASVSILEAMAHGLTVISSVNNGTAHYVEEGHAGHVFDPCNPHELSDLLYELIENPKKVIEYGENALIAVRKNHSQNMFYQIFGDMLEKEFGIDQL